MRRLLTLTLALAIAIPALAAQDTIRRGFNVTDGGTLRLTAGIGNVTVVSGGNGVAIEIVRESHGRRGEEMMREHDIDIRQSGNDVIIDGKLDRGNSWFRIWDSDDYEVKWNIRVPARYNVDLSTSGGSINLADMGGTVEARTSGGGIRTGKLGGTANLRTSGGSVTVAGGSGKVNAHTSGGSIEIGDTTGEVEAKTSGGGIRLGRVGGSVLARTSGGSIRIDDASGAVDASTSGGSITATLSGQPRGDSRLSTSGGGVTVSLAGGISVDVDAKASGGGVHSDVPVTVQGTQDEGELPKLVLRTSGGGIRLKSL